VSQNGQFRQEELDIVRLTGSDGGWINYGLYAVKIERYASGVRVEVYPCQNEATPLASVSVSDKQARTAGATNCEKL
jgi:hypothetical protein